VSYSKDHLADLMKAVTDSKTPEARTIAEDAVLEYRESFALNEELVKLRRRRNARRLLQDEEAAGDEVPEFLSADERMREPRPDAVVDGFLWPGQKTVLVSDSGLGKTFFVFSVCGAVSDAASEKNFKGASYIGSMWMGERVVEPGSVAYISFEGDALGIRLAALADSGKNLDRFFTLRMSAPITTPTGEKQTATALAKVADKIREADGDKYPLRVIVFDTVRQAMTGDEDSSDDMTDFIHAVKRICEPYKDAAILLVHHTGWQDANDPKKIKKRERGSSALRGNADNTFILLEDKESAAAAEGYLVMLCLKMKDGRKSKPLSMQRVERADSCVMVKDERKREPIEVKEAREEDELRVAVLEAVRDSHLNNKDEVRVKVGKRKPEVGVEINELIAGKFIIEGKRGEPFIITKNGLDFLVKGEADRSGPKRTADPQS